MLHTLHGQHFQLSCGPLLLSGDLSTLPPHPPLSTSPLLPSCVRSSNPLACSVVDAKTIGYVFWSFASGFWGNLSPASDLS